MRVSYVFLSVCLCLLGIGTVVCVCFRACGMSVGVWSPGVAADREAWPTSHHYPSMLFFL